jgi:hypothetical protein
MGRANYSIVDLGSHDRYFAFGTSKLPYPRILKKGWQLVVSEAVTQGTWQCDLISKTNYYYRCISLRKKSIPCEATKEKERGTQGCVVHFQQHFQHLIVHNMTRGPRPPKKKCSFDEDDCLRSQNRTRDLSITICYYSRT